LKTGIRVTGTRVRAKDAKRTGGQDAETSAACGPRIACRGKSVTGKTETHSPRFGHVNPRRMAGVGRSMKFFSQRARDDPENPFVLCRYRYNSGMGKEIKALVWIGSAKKDFMKMPDEVQDTFGYALYLAQAGKKHGQAKPLKGFGSAGVLEVVEDNAGSAYRAVYTVRLHDTVYVLHCFQKKSTHGIATPKADLELIRERLKTAETYAERERK
jgi:phage-related protein